MWNGLFALLFKSLSERVSGPDSASELFYTLIYMLYHDINLDSGSVISAQFVQSTISSTRHAKIPCAHFWSIVVNQALIHYKVPQMKDSLIAEISILQTTTFVKSDPRNFEFVGSIPEVLLKRVPLENAIIKDYRKFPSSSGRAIHVELKKIIDETRW